MITEPNSANAFAVMERASELMAGFVSDRDFLDMLRVLQVTILQGHSCHPSNWRLSVRSCPRSFPRAMPLMNRELIRLLAYMQESSIMDRYFDYLHSDAPHPDKVPCGDAS